MTLCAFALCNVGVCEGFFFTHFMQNCMWECAMCACVFKNEGLGIEKGRMKKDGVCIQVSIRVRDLERPRIVCLCVYVGG